jgi:hypothetical protein
MKRCLIECLAGLILCSVVSSSLQADDAPLQILVITDGCCHDYAYQTESMQKAFKRADVAAEWTVVAEGGKGTQAEIKFYDDPDWAKGFDVVIHNECFANTDNPEYIRKITDAHKAGVNAVVIHCAMHTYRAAKIDDWREFLGVTSRRHEHKAEYPVRVVAEKHPVMQGFPADWKTPKDELYVIEKVWPKTKGWPHRSARSPANCTRCCGRISTARLACSGRPTGTPTRRLRIPCS